MLFLPLCNYPFLLPCLIFQGICYWFSRLPCFIFVWIVTLIFSGLWNQIFLGTYTALFLAMPFAYFFTESEGLAGSRKVLFQNRLLHIASCTKIFYELFYHCFPYDFTFVYYCCEFDEALLIFLWLCCDTSYFFDSWWFLIDFCVILWPIMPFNIWLIDIFLWMWICDLPFGYLGIYWAHCADVPHYVVKNWY